MTRKVQARTLATRDRLLAAGREILATGPMAALRTDDVVARAGTAKGTFFAHFPDRDHFLAALLAESLASDLAEMPVVTDRAALDTVLHRMFAAFTTDDETVALLARFSGPAGAGLGLDVLICHVVERLAASIAGLQAMTRVRNPAAPDILAEALVALVFHAAASAQCAVNGDRDAVRTRAEGLLRQMTDALLG